MVNDEKSLSLPSVMGLRDCMIGLRFGSTCSRIYARVDLRWKKSEELPDDGLVSYMRPVPRYPDSK